MNAGTFQERGPSLFRDASVVSLLIANMLTLGIALFEQWPIAMVLWVYWSQSVIIGVFNFVRMVGLREFSTDGLSSNGKTVPETTAGKWRTAIFFVLHYGFFHAAYAVFVGSVSTGLVRQDALWILTGAAFFLVNNLRSYCHAHRVDLKGRPNLGAMMMFPYARIVPMHLCIIFFGYTIENSEGGPVNWAVLAVFMLLKTGADVVMELVEQHLLRRSAKKAHDAGVTGSS